VLRSSPWSYIHPQGALPIFAAGKHNGELVCNRAWKLRSVRRCNSLTVDQRVWNLLSDEGRCIERVVDVGVTMNGSLREDILEKLT